MIGHESISAAAGSGKTYQLAHRYIRLISLGVSPEKIVALTFSRKAAGEIFDNIVGYLYEAAYDPDKAKTTAKEIHSEQDDCATFAGYLRSLLHALHRLNIGTLDSFCVRIVQSFPMELGIGIDFQVMDNNSAEAVNAHENMLLRLFDPQQISKEDKKFFIESFKEATFGVEEQKLSQSLTYFIKQYRDDYLESTDESLWGRPDRIWSELPWWDAPKLSDPKQVAAQTIDELEGLSIHKGLIKSFVKLADFASDYHLHAHWGKGPGGGAALTHLIEYAIGNGSGSLNIHYSRKDCVIPEATAKKLIQLLQHVIGIEMHQLLRQTNGLFRIMHWYEKLYDRYLRRQGMLTFNDIQFLLTHHNDYSGGALISRKPSEDQRLYIDYRMHCELDHWLLDEFQDTSNLQWGALSNLVDEIVQDAEHSQTFFYVGDKKQAIYSWRGGNPRLFDQIQAKYGSQINPTSLVMSYRSCPALIDMVNQAFQIPKGHHHFAEKTLLRWSSAFEPHQSAEQQLTKSGCSAMLISEDIEQRFDLIAKLIGEIKPLERGLSVAILARSNEQVRRIVNELRAHDQTAHMTISQEGRSPLLDDTLVNAFISLIRLALHPGDLYALRHVQMSPLQAVLENRNIDSKAIPKQVLNEIHERGFRDFFTTWSQALRSHVTLSPFCVKRLGDLLLAATEFDAGHNANPELFLRFLETYEIHEQGSEAAVRVMTVHQSKGLGFDIVLLPELRGDTMGYQRDLGLLKCRDAEENISWLLKNPINNIRSCDPTLQGQYESMSDEKAYDDLCVLYVALTRAKRGMYLITDIQPPSDTRYHAADFLQEQFTGHDTPFLLNGEEIPATYVEGDPHWYTACEPAPPDEMPEDFQLSETYALQDSTRRGLNRIRPSEHKSRSPSAGELFAPRNEDAIELGNAIHALFEQVSYSDDLDVHSLLAEWRETSKVRSELQSTIEQHFLNATAQPDIIKVLNKPDVPSMLWREQTFECVLDDRWVTGVIDRAVIAKDLSSAAIIDFKSNQSGDEATLVAHYRPQMELYREVVSEMMNISEENITTYLVFTATGSVVDL